jgi:4-hydroxy-L-threonine phosphate dehydrogenase PdxA
MKGDYIVIVAGEPNSIFLEVLFKALKFNKYKSPIILICNKDILINHMKKNKFKKGIKLLNLSKLSEYILDNRSINLVNIEFNLNKSNKYINECFKIAFKIIKNKFSNKLINGPINKKTFLNRKFPGITEYVSNKFKAPNTGMLIYNKNLSVLPLTTHLPIKYVPRKISKKLILDKIELVNKFYKEYFNFKPRIAITGLNPHCESISNFNEDTRIILPTVNSIKKKNININGPFSADTIFQKKNRKKFDIIIGMYHDQVLAPIKTLFEFNAINITIGLPFLRITPDHGPNKEMVGKNKSDPTSIINALNFLDKN